MAFYLSSRLFMYYHTLANNRALMAPDAKRTRIWFPLFSFFESKCEGRLSNQFELPFKYIIPCWNVVQAWLLSVIPCAKNGASTGLTGCSEKLASYLSKNQPEQASKVD